MRLLSLTASWLIFWCSPDCVAASMELTIGNRHVDYQERLGGETIVAEKGGMHRFDVAYERKTAGNFNIKAAYALQQGTLAYRGQTQLGRPLSTSARHTQRSVAILGKYYLNLRQVRLTAAMGSQWVDRRRVITATPTTTQFNLNYRWVQWLASLELNVPIGNSIEFLLGYAHRKSQSGRIDLSFDFADAQPIRLNANQREQRSFSGGLRKNWPAWSAAIVVEKQSWRWQESDAGFLSGPLSLTFREPQSQQNSRSAFLIVTRSF